MLERAVTMQSTSTAILIPTLGRPHRVAEVHRSARDHANGDVSIYFVVEQDDADTIAAVTRTGAGMIINRGAPTYASCINQAYLDTQEPFFVLGSDDIEFLPRWLDEAMACMDDPAVGMVGVRDPLHPLVDHSTHSLVRRRYIEERSGCMDLPNTVLYPYKHGWTDWEMASVAKVRGAYRYCATSLVKHLHPGWETGGMVRTDHELYDATYAKGNRTVGEDFDIFSGRARAWVKQLARRKPLTPADRKIVGRVMAREFPVRARLRRYSLRMARILDQARARQERGSMGAASGQGAGV